MITKTTKDDMFFLEFNAKSPSPIVVNTVFLDSEFEFSEPKYFRWHLTLRGEDLNEIDMNFGEGTLSPEQNTVLLLHRASKDTGGYVELLPQYQYCPVLVGSNKTVVPLYEFVEVLDASVDYDKIREELPSLSYAQIHGSLMFLRKVAQFNIHDIDIDEKECEKLAQDQDYIDELRRAFADREKTRVLNFDERDR